MPCIQFNLRSEVIAFFKKLEGNKPEMNQEIHTKKYDDGSQGAYYCKCATCGIHFIGHKLDVNCGQHGHQCLMLYIMGWRKGAGGGVIDDEKMKDADYHKGWEDGRQAKAEAYEKACKLYGATLNVLREQAPQHPSMTDNPGYQGHPDFGKGASEP